MAIFPLQNEYRRSRESGTSDLPGPIEAPFNFVNDCDG
jgi:hypothetical protein